LPAPSPSHRALSSRGVQLAAATLLGLATVALLIGVLALGLFEDHTQGPATWFQVPATEDFHASAAP